MACSNCRKIKHELKVAKRSSNEKYSSSNHSSEAAVEARYFESERDKTLASLARLATSTQDFLLAQTALTEALSTSDKIDANLLKRAQSKATFLSRFLEDTLASTGIQKVEMIGQVYSAGLQVEVTNLEDFSASDQLVIDEVLRPVLLFKPTSADEKPKLLQVGRVTVKKVEA